MYAPDTILKLKEQREPVKIPAKKDPDSGRTRKAHEIPFAYNTVRVIGVSPIAHTAGDPGVILEPLAYHGSTLDEPLSKVQRLYDIESEPTNEIIIEPIKVIRADTREAGLTPEEVFAIEAPSKPRQPGEPHPPISPLEDDYVPEPDSPLGD